MFAISQARVPTVLCRIPYEPGLVSYYPGRRGAGGNPINSG